MGVGTFVLEWALDGLSFLELELELIQAPGKTQMINNHCVATGPVRNSREEILSMQ